MQLQRYKKPMSLRVIWELASHVTMYECVLDFDIQDPFKIGVSSLICSVIGSVILNWGISTCSKKD
jgi:hypothetical protein